MRAMISRVSRIPPSQTEILPQFSLTASQLKPGLGFAAKRGYQHQCIKLENYMSWTQVLDRAIRLVLTHPFETLRVSAPGLVLLFLGLFVYGHLVLVPFEQGIAVYRITMHATIAGCVLAIIIINVPLHRYFLPDRFAARKQVWSKLMPYLL